MSLTPRACSDDEQAADGVRAYLEWLLERAEFRASARRRKLLAYVVYRTLAG